MEATSLFCPSDESTFCHVYYLPSKVVDGRVPENQALHGDTSPSKHTDITAVVYV